MVSPLFDTFAAIRLVIVGSVPSSAAVNPSAAQSDGLAAGVLLVFWVSDL
jgi:hypothetical protein